MAEPVWPLLIGDRPLRENAGYQPMANQDAFQPDDGEGFEVTWPKAAQAPLRMSPTYCMTPAQFQAWMLWWVAETRSGTVPFQLRDPYDRQVYYWKLQANAQIRADKTWPQEVRVTLPLLRVP